MSSAAKRSWRGNLSVLWWRGQYILWGVVLAGIVINLVSSWLTTKQWQVSGTPIGWLLAHPAVPVAGGVVLILQTIGAFWIVRRGNSPEPSSASSRVEQREQTILRACGDIEPEQPRQQFRSVAILLHALQGRYAVQEIINTLEYLKQKGDIELTQPFAGSDPFAGAEKWSFRLTPKGNRARELLP